MTTELLQSSSQKKMIRDRKVMADNSDPTNIVNDFERKFLENQFLRARERTKTKDVRRCDDNDNSENITIVRELFWSTFKAECNELHHQLDLHCQKENFITAAQRIEGKVTLEKISIRFKNLDDPNATPELGADIRLVVEGTNNLRQRIEDLRDLVCPKEKFTFKRYHDFRKTRYHNLETSEDRTTFDISLANDMIRDTSFQNGGDAKTSSLKENSETSAPNKEDHLLSSGSQTDQFDSDMVVLENVSDQVIILENDTSLTDKKKSFLMKNLQRCTVILKQSYGTIYLKHLSQCTICSYPVSGSVFLHSCQNTNLTLSSRQLRIHDSTSLSFHVMVLSGPIIENCRGMVFGGDYIRQLWSLSRQQRQVNAANREEFRKEIEKVMVDCALLENGNEEEEKSCNLFWNVKDFNWHKLMQKSPNFEVREGEEEELSITDNIDTNDDMLNQDEDEL